MSELISKLENSAIIGLEGSVVVHRVKEHPEQTVRIQVYGCHVIFISLFEI